MAAAVPTKVFVGNLSFKTREADLAKAFETAGKVVSANIITRGPRSLGYGFVELSSAEEADKAIATLNKTELDGRQINVEIARPRDPNATPAPAPGGNRPRPRRRQRRPQRQTTSAPTGSAPPASGEKQVADRERRPRRPSQPTGEKQQIDGRRPQRRTRPGYYRYNNYRRVRREPRKDESKRIPSTTTLFVANLHYQIDNAGLAEIFKKFNPVKAYVVQTRTGRSRGFGFVEFANEKDQQDGLKDCDKQTVRERQISVKVSQVREQAPATATPTATN